MISFKHEKLDISPIMVVIYTTLINILKIALDWQINFKSTLSFYQGEKKEVYFVVCVKTTREKIIKRIMHEM